MTIPHKAFSVSEIVKRYLTDGTVPVSGEQRPYDYEHIEDFDGDMSKQTKIDLFSVVSRESREAAAKKAAMSTPPSGATPAPAQAPSATEPPAAPSE